MARVMPHRSSKKGACRHLGEEPALGPIVRGGPIRTACGLTARRGRGYGSRVIRTLSVPSRGGSQETVG